jgi:dihydrofolate synthase / folylpolyglutamate synthase
MSYAAAVDHLYALGHELAPTPSNAPRRKFDLAHMRILAAALGDPHAGFPSVLIAGTNGKGSTAAILASILTAAGYRTGLYTSPHLIRVNERIQIDGVQIPDEDFARLYFQVDETARRLVEAGDLPHPPSFFEVLTALAFLYFAGNGPGEAKPVDIAILEVGLGGRLDATNIVDPLLSIITDIALDHQDYLGDTIAEITREKAGILRRNGTLITLPQHPEANQAIGEAAVALNVRGINATAALPYDTSAVTNTRNRYPLDMDGLHIEVDSPLAGQHQQRNIALAITAALELRNIYSYDIDAEAISAGIRQTRWLARLEKFTHHGRSILLDVGHNPAGAWTLRAALSAEKYPPRNLIFGCLDDKPVEELAQILFPLFDRVLLVPVPSPRAATGDRLLAAANTTGTAATLEPNLAAALTASADQDTVITGSVYLVGEARALLIAEGWTSDAG